MDSTRDQIFIWTIFGTLMVLGFLAGVARLRVPRAPGLAASAIVAAYVALLAVTGGWVAACPGCTSHISYDSARPVDLFAAIFLGGLFTAAIILFISLGTGVSFVVQKLAQRRG